MTKRMKYGKKYYYIGNLFIPEMDEWLDLKLDEYRLKIGNVFPTKIKAIAAAKRVKAALKGESSFLDGYKCGYNCGFTDGKESKGTISKSKFCETQLPKNFGKLK